MDRKISFQEAQFFKKEIVEVEIKIRNSKCAKNRSSLNQFNWYIRSCRVMPKGKTIIHLVAKTRGIGYSARVKDILQNVIDYLDSDI